MITFAFAGLYATSSILAALMKRDSQLDGKGGGQHIDLSLFDVSVAFLANQVSPGMRL